MYNVVVVVIYLPISTMTTSSWAQSLISHNQALMLSYVVLLVTSYSKSKA